MGYVVLTLSVNEASKDDFNPHSAGFIFFFHLLLGQCRQTHFNVFIRIR